MFSTNPHSRILVSSSTFQKHWFFPMTKQPFIRNSHTRAPESNPRGAPLFTKGLPGDARCEPKKGSGWGGQVPNNSWRDWFETHGTPTYLYMKRHETIIPTIHHPQSTSNASILNTKHKMNIQHPTIHKHNSCANACPKFWFQATWKAASWVWCTATSSSKFCHCGSCSWAIFAAEIFPIFQLFIKEILKYSSSLPFPSSFVEYSRIEASLLCKWVICCYFCWCLNRAK